MSKVYTRLEYQMLPDGNLKLVKEESYDYSGVVAQCLRAEEGMAKTAARTAADTGTLLGQRAAGEIGQLQPFAQREMQAQHAFSPTQINELLTAAGAGTGAAEGTAEAELQRQGAASGNAAGQTKSLQEMARDRMKTAAGTSEGVASQDVQGALQKQQQGAGLMSGLYGENLKGQLDAMGQVSGDINAATNASKTGWLQNAEQIGSMATGAFKGHI